jgi:hypothetical protein
VNGRVAHAPRVLAATPSRSPRTAEPVFSCPRALGTAILRFTVKEQIPILEFNWYGDLSQGRMIAMSVNLRSERYENVLLEIGDVTSRVFLHA